MLYIISYTLQSFFFKFQFKTFVTSLERAVGHWNVTYTKLDTKVQATEACDYVIVANGEFLNPYIPKFQGLDLFKGKIVRKHNVHYTVSNKKF